MITSFIQQQTLGQIRFSNDSMVQVNDIWEWFNERSESATKANFDDKIQEFLIITAPILQRS